MVSRVDDTNGRAIARTAAINSRAAVIQRSLGEAGALREGSPTGL
jgi:hypothetical protein